MVKILVINGPNLNMLGQREVEIYGKQSLKDLNKIIKHQYKKISFTFRQTNSETKIITYLQTAKKYQAILLNAGAYAHTSLAIMDAAKLLKVPLFNIHLSDITKREPFRQHDYLAMVATKTFMGEGVNSYLKAITYFGQNYLR